MTCRTPDAECFHIPPQAWTWGLTEEPDAPARPATKGLKDGGHWQGMPLGGLGSGGIVRNYRGAFSRWTLKAGSLNHFVDPANMFAVRQCVDGEEPHAVALHPGYPTARPGQEPARRPLGAWNWDLSAPDATYHALYPKAWCQYPATTELPVSMVCEQFSPILPGNYRETSYPVAVFAWHLRNTTAKAVKVSVMFSWTNMVGWFDEFNDGRPPRKSAGNVNRPVHDGALTGIVFDRHRAGIPVCEGHGQFCVAAQPSSDCTVTYLTAFDPRGNGQAVWQSFAENGALSNTDESPTCSLNRELAGAVCVEIQLAPGAAASLPFVLAWDFPVIRFGSGRRHWRRHTRFFGRDGTHAAEIAATALENWRDWSAQIDAWHASTIAEQRGPDWYYTMLFNEAYLLTDGYTVWTDGEVDSPDPDPFFGIIECPDYPFYCTLDLWIYGSFILLKHWPELETNVIRRFADCILSSDERRRDSSHFGLFASKVRGAAPHDFGEPREDPPVVCNSYVHKADSNRWKDLNCEFVLTLYRDVTTLNDDALLEACWPAAKLAIEYLRDFDRDGDGLIENDGTPDQTMDNIPMKGPSAYCGGLWLAALTAAVKLAERIGDRAFVAAWREPANSARRAFDEHLWDGEKYRFDTEGPFSRAIFIDALFGIWFARLCGLRSIVPEQHLRASVARAYQRNVLDFHSGRYGGANITGGESDPKGTGESIFDTIGCQVSEVLSGLNMSFALQLRDCGMHAESLAVLEALYHVIYRDYGLWFRTPAAWTADGTFRAIMNLRPLVIWAMEFGE